jgi:hypothetical protein
MDVFVVPLWGLYANLIAQLLSQISSHFIVHYHRLVVRRAKETYQERHHTQSQLAILPEQAADEGIPLNGDLPPDERKSQLCKHAFTRPHKENSDKLVVRRYINFLLPFGSVLLGILLAIACVLPSLTLEAHGLIGILIEFYWKLREEAVRYKSVFEIAATFVDQARYMGGFKNYVGIGFMSLLFVVTIFIVPVALLAVLVFQWLYPLAKKGRERAALVLEILHAWQYVEVYILAIIIQSW